ncbi:F-box domain-containing protein [Favolaschia claudopus]|uniref:F-box domain-containing protein n=1 Tax=Favolaschia claudopus TaxID=2862362 RepID=A0AAV9ZD14_9AGAR
MIRVLQSDRALLAKKELEIHDLEAQMAVIAERLSVLRSEKLEIKNRLDSYTYSALPNEITAEIFLQFLPPYPVAPPMLGPRSPILLTKICRQWREVALTTPMLWRAITLPGV